MTCSMLPRAVDLIKIMPHSFLRISIQERELYLGGFIKNVFSTGLHSDAYSSISFKLGIILDTPKPYSFTPV